MPKFPVILLVLFVASWLAASAHADLELVFDVSTTLEDPETGDRTTSAITSMQAMFRDDQLYIVSADGEELYDFESRRIIHISPSNAEYAEWSLYALIGFREYEFRNREVLDRMMRKLGIDEELPRMALAEHELSILSASRDTKIDIEVRDGLIVFRADGEQLLALSEARVAIPSPYQSQFRRFFRHHFGGHPKLLDELVTEEGIPERIIITFPGAGFRSYDLRLVSSGEVDPLVLDLSKLTPTGVDDPQIAALISRVMTEPASERDQIRDEAFEAARTAGEHGEDLAAACKYFEYNLMLARPSNPWTEPVRKRIVGNEDVRDLLKAVKEGNDPELAPGAVLALRQARRTIGDPASVLRVYESNAQATLGEHAKALALMVKALQDNPYLVGAWKDMGQFWFDAYDPLTAWACWGTARSIAPDHPSLIPVAEFEAHLLDTYPDYF